MSSGLALQDFLSRHLPLTAAMGVKVECACADCVDLRVPLQPNLNHELTAFGGSISTVGILAGWGWLWTQLHTRDPMPRLIIGHSTTRYIRPIDTDFEARCSHPGGAAFEQFEQTFAASGKARLALRSEVTVSGKIAAVHDGIYVAIDPGRGAS